MALSTQIIVKAKRQTFSAAKTLGIPSDLHDLVQTLFSQIVQKHGAPDLQVVVAKANSTTDTVIADAACKLYAVIGKAGSSAADVRWADHASSADTPTTTLAVGASENFAYVYPGGKAFSTGLTFDESTTSGSNLIFIIGAP